MSEKIVIEYRTQKNYCHCCEQKLPNVETSEVREFTISKENIMSWGGDWQEFAEFEEDLIEIVKEFVYETISFFATNFHDRVIVESSEFKKVKQFILKEVVSA